jgi:hypothetical protein
MILEIQGGTSNGTTSSQDIAIGTKNMFGGTNAYPWSPTVTTTANKVTVLPAAGASSGRSFVYDIHVELLSSVNGKLTTIKFNNDSESKKTFTY